MSRASQTLANSIRRLQTEYPLDIVRGIEGESANAYFEVFDHLITAQKDDFFFHETKQAAPAG